MITLLEKSIKYYTIIGLLLYTILYVLYGDAYSYYNGLNFVVFISYAFLLYIAFNRQEGYCNVRRLATTVFVYTLFVVWMYQYMCDYYKGNTFLFSEADSLTYENYSLRMAQMPIEEWIPFLISKRWGYDDWGAWTVVERLKRKNWSKEN